VTAALEIKVTNRLGLHARPAAMVVRAAAPFEAEVFLIKDEVRINAKSIMGVMMLAASRGTRLTIRANGKDERDAVDSLERLIEEKFGEQE
jgi:phosphocarrier protein